MNPLLPILCCVAVLVWTGMSLSGSPAFPMPEPSGLVLGLIAITVAVWIKFRNRG
jgi:uncharacterized membrane protein (DUF441 family)